jgi:FtsH-binding integral membrane protein
MEPNWAAEHLQVIRTLMERSALYRRALGPIMIACGVIGLAAATTSCFVKIERPSHFAAFWLGVSLLGLVVSFLLVRRQALKEAEPFWSPPTRRVSQALLPAFVVGLVGGIVFLAHPSLDASANWYLAVFWTAIYGCALHAAGFFMQRGIRLFGWIFILGATVAFMAGFARPELRTSEAAHYVMGLFFGLLHLAYGIYLYFTERSRKSA